MRLFIALDVNSEVEQYLNNINRQLDKGYAKLKPVAGYHITLKFLGNTEPEKVKQALANISFTPFELITKGLGHFGKRVIWAGVEPKEPVIELQREIDKELFKIGFEREKKFHPHITIARVKKLFNSKRLMATLKDIKKEEIPLKISSIVLYQSQLTPQGPIYSVVKRFKAG